MAHLTYSLRTKESSKNITSLRGKEKSVFILISKARKDSRLKNVEEIEQTKYEGNNRIMNKIVKLKVEKLTTATKQ